MKKGFFCGLTTGVVLTGASLVLANSQIQAILNDQIKVTLNGQVQEFRDETTGEIQYPITYHDRTYLPLRNVAQLAGLNVGWDGNSNTAILTTTNYQSEKTSEWKENEVQTNNKVGSFSDVNGNGFLGIADSTGVYVSGYINYKDSVVKNSTELFAITDYSIEYKVNSDKTISITKIIGISDNDLKAILSNANKDSNKKVEYEGIGVFSYMQGDNYVIIEGIDGNQGARGYVDYGDAKSIVSSSKDLFDIYSNKVAFAKYEDGSIVITQIHEKIETEEEKEQKRIITPETEGYIDNLTRAGTIRLISNGKKVNGTVYYDGPNSKVKDYDELMSYYEKDLKYTVYEDNMIVITGFQRDANGTGTGVVDRIGLNGGVVINSDRGGLVAVAVDYDNSIVKNQSELEELIGQRVKYVWDKPESLVITRILNLK